MKAYKASQAYYYSYYYGGTERAWEAFGIEM